LQTLDKPAEVFHDDLATVHIKDWENGRILLAGDSQHAMTPLLGMGASMAMEDAMVLVEELSAVNGEAARIDNALLKYAERRGKRVRHVQNVSGFLWKLAAVESNLLCKVRDATMKHLPSDYIYTPIQGLFQTSI
jgi:2-polyprenyl-6-methoxyphenol hydroxylase-like FAD-dependent oxidoreductase